jgi:hypothetical protein
MSSRFIDRIFAHCSSEGKHVSGCCRRGSSHYVHALPTFPVLARLSSERTCLKLSNDVIPITRYEATHSLRAIAQLNARGDRWSETSRSAGLFYRKTSLPIAQHDATLFCGDVHHPQSNRNIVLWRCIASNTVLWRLEGDNKWIICRIYKHLSEIETRSLWLPSVGKKYDG